MELISGSEIGFLLSAEAVEFACGESGVAVFSPSLLQDAKTSKAMIETGKASLLNEMLIMRRGFNCFAI